MMFSSPSLLSLVATTLLARTTATPRLLPLQPSTSSSSLAPLNLHPRDPPGDDERRIDLVFDARYHSGNGGRWITANVNKGFIDDIAICHGGGDSWNSVTFRGGKKDPWEVTFEVHGGNYCDLGKTWENWDVFDNLWLRTNESVQINAPMDCQWQYEDRCVEPIVCKKGRLIHCEISTTDGLTSDGGHWWGKGEGDW